MLPRFVAFAAIVLLLAVAVPALAPNLVATLQPQAAIATDEPADAAALQVTVDADDRGHFVTEAAIDGRTVPVVIDTGATTVALTAATAHSLGIQLTPVDYTASVRTANGTVRAAPIEIGVIRLGNVTVHDVAAVVVEGDALELNLLGMSFLNRLTKFEAGGGQLVLVQ